MATSQVTYNYTIIIIRRHYSLTRNIAIGTSSSIGDTTKVMSIAIIVLKGNNYNNTPIQRDVTIVERDEKYTVMDTSCIYTE